MTGWVVVTLIRVWVALPVRLPTENPDEVGYLDATRLLAGGTPRFDLSYNTFYRGGYPLLLLPARWLSGSDPSMLYRAAQVENAAIGAALLPLAWLLARRCGLSRERALLVGAATAILPVPVLLGTHVWTDAVLPTLILAWLLSAYRWLTASTSAAGRIWWGVAASALAAFTAPTHARGELIVGAQLVVIALAAVRRRRSPLDCAIAALALVPPAALGAVLNRDIQRRIYPAGIKDLAGEFHDRVVSPSGWGWIFRLATGQCWYQIAATGGVFAIGSVALFAHARRRDAAGPSRALAGITLALVVGIASCTSAALPDDHRIGDTVAMGRYLGGTMTPTLFAVGLVALLRCDARRVRRLGFAAAAALAGSTAVVVLCSQDRLRHDFFSRTDFPEFAALNGDSQAHLLRVAVVSAALLAAMVAAATRCRNTVALAGLLAAVSLATSGLARDQVLRPTSAAMASMVTASDVAIDQPARVALDTRIPWWVRLPLTYEHRWRSVTLFDGSQQAPPNAADLVFMSWDGRAPAEGSWSGPAGAGRAIVGQAASSLGPGLSPTGWVAWLP